VRAVAFLALVFMFQGLLGPLAAVPYDRWLRRHLHWKIPIGRIPGTPLMESVVGFMFGVPLLLMVALFAGLMLGYLALVEFIPPSWVPRGARTAVAWGVLALVALALMALAVWVFARWLARTALHDCLDDRDDAMSPQTRIMGVTLGATLLAGLLAIGATTQGNRAASALRTGKRVADTQRWANEQLLPAVVCVDATWVGPPPAPAGLDHAVLYLGGHNDQVLLYDRQRDHTTWLYAASVTLVHAAC